MSKKVYAYPVPVVGGGIAPSGAESNDHAVIQFIQKLAGLVLTNLPTALLRVVLRGMRQERPPKSAGIRTMVDTADGRLS
jgi:hypothetical protein